MHRSCWEKRALSLRDPQHWGAAALSPKGVLTSLLYMQGWPMFKGK